MKDARLLQKIAWHFDTLPQQDMTESEKHVCTLLVNSKLGEWRDCPDDGLVFHKCLRPH